MKKLVSYLCCALICCLLFINSPAAVDGAVRAFSVWANSVLPALLPFFVCAYIMQGIDVPPKLERAMLIVMCVISGAPSGARLLGAYEAPDSRSVAILNTVSPMFIYAVFCGSMLGAPALALPILISMALSTVLMLFIFPLKSGMAHTRKQELSPLILLGKGLSGGIAAMLNICAAMMFFMAVMGAVFGQLQPHGILSAVLMGMLEMVSGSGVLCGISATPAATAAAAAFIFSFGGVCIFIQSLVFCKLSPAEYFSTKLLQGAVAAAAAYLLTPLFSGIRPVFAQFTAEQLLCNASVFLSTAGASTLSMSLVMLIGAAARRRKEGR